MKNCSLFESSKILFVVYATIAINICSYHG